MTTMATTSTTLTTQLLTAAQPAAAQATRATRAVALAQARVASCRRMSCAFILMPLSSGVMEQPGTGAETETELHLDWESDFAV